MKTPRQILLERHRAAETKLDRIRQEVVAQIQRSQRNDEAITSSQTDDRRPPESFVARLWLELIWVNRGFWAGLSAVWLLIIALNQAAAEGVPTGPAGSMADVPAMLAIVQEQKRLALDLSEPVARPSLDTPVDRPRPRTDLGLSNLQIA